MTLDAVTMENFKCFRSLRLPLAPLTLLTGFNAAGKSTSLQPLLLLAQSLRASAAAELLHLNGSLVRLGTTGETLAANSSERVMSIGVNAGSIGLAWKLKASEQTGNHALAAVSVSMNDGEREVLISNRVVWPLGSDQIAADAIKLVRDIIYLGATRGGTAEILPIPDAVDVHADVGVSGEFAPWWYAHSADEPIDEARRHPAEQGLTLRRQLDAYLSELFTGGQATAEIVPKAQFVRLGLRTSEQSDWLRPANTGYGLSYAFPLLVTLLLSKPGQVVVIDSPEAHLHPSGQSRIGKILARFAAAGVQILVETHSDHVLNGVRLAVMGGVVAANSTLVHFFRGSPAGSLENGIISLRLDANGSIDQWPEGFFDQSERDLATISGFGQ